MLRTAIILLVTILVLAGAFAIYLSTQTTSKIADRPENFEPVAPLKTDPGVKPPYDQGGPGVLKQYNKDTGALSSQMEWHSFTRLKDGSTTVVAPVISFNLSGNRRLMIVGETALIDDFHAPEMTAASAKQPIGMPDRGTMQHVHIYLYPNWEANAQPNIILTTDNLAFDNATFRIATAGYTDDHGNAIAADEVPVHVTGDYLFDGRGLTVQWNDRDNRLELLEVAHGEQLTILHPNTVFGSSAEPASQPGSLPPHAAAEPMDASPDGSEGTRSDRAGAAPDARLALASADPNLAAMALPATRPASPAKPPQPPYLARFFEKVIITQGLLTKITGDTMDVGFVLKPSGATPAAKPTKAPAGLPSPAAQQASMTDHPISGAKEKADGPTASAATPAPQSAPSASQEPVVIRWTGPLRITPAPFPLDLTAGTSVVTLFGKPVVARHIDPVQLQTTEVQSATMVYYTADGSVALRCSSEVPKVLITRFDNSIGDVTTMRVIAQDFDYVGRNQEAVFTGPGEAHLPAGPDAADPSAKTMDASWQQSAKIFLLSTGHGQSAVSRAVLAGDVNIAHPQLSLQSQLLDLRFAPPAATMGESAAPAGSGNGALRQVIAGDSVNCRLTDSAGKKQTIDCQKLDVRMGEDREKNVYPRELLADGNVQAFDSEQELDAGHLEASLTPTQTHPRGDIAGASGKQQAVGLRGLYASDHVKLHGKSEQLATCDELLVDGDPAQGGRVELVSHGGLATVVDHQNIITGPTIVMNSATQQDTIIGPGTLHLIHQSTAAAKPSNPIHVIWSDRAVVDGAANAIDAFGKVVITQVAEDKSVETAHAPHLRIDLEDKPTASAKPATQPVLVAGPSTDVFKSKQARAVTLDQGVDIRSTLNDPTTGALERDLLLKAPTVVYLPGQGAGQETMEVPSAGQMLVRDYRAADGANATASTGGAPRPAADDQHGMKGLTAFAWKKSLTYTAIDHKAVMLQDVHVKHQDNDQSDPAELFAQRVTANFAPGPAKPKTAADTDPAAVGPMQLKSLDADTDLTVIHDDLKTHNDSKITGTRLEYDPASHLLTVLGTSANPVVFFDSTASRITQALVAKWNTQTWNIDFQNMMTRDEMKQK